MQNNQQAIQRLRNQQQQLRTLIEEEKKARKDAKGLMIKAKNAKKDTDYYKNAMNFMSVAAVPFALAGDYKTAGAAVATAVTAGGYGAYQGINALHHRRQSERKQQEAHHMRRQISQSLTNTVRDIQRLGQNVGATNVQRHARHSTTEETGLRHRVNARRNMSQNAQTPTIR